MRKRIGWIRLAAVAIVVTVGVAAFSSRVAFGDQRSIEVGGRTRTYQLHGPSGGANSAPLPLVFVFHGGGGNGAQMERMTRFDALADRDGFVAVYPDGFGGNWNDGREFNVSRAHRLHIDDVGFVSALIDAVSSAYSIDPKRVFATGISNGGIFSHYLGARLSNRIAAIAPVAGGIAAPFAPQFNPAQPVSVFILQGTADPIVPYHGGGVLRGARGHIVDTDVAVQLWVSHDGCAPTPSTGALPDTVKTDGCTVDWKLWSGGQQTSEVELYTINGGGHTWPDGPQYLPRALVGRVCRDFDASSEIWTFFKAHTKP
jgi:polyhydroxybutyrate depolymerase